MRRPFSLIASVAVSVIMLLDFPAYPWGCEGHQIVAKIARAQLSQRARNRADDLLRNNPMDANLSRFCKSQGLDRFTDSSTWADDVRNSRRESAPWHFIDIPRSDTSGNVAAHCPTDEGCVTKAIQDDISILKSTGATGSEKADALRYLIHFVGDLHQPLHCADNNDRGGNCVFVRRVTAQSRTKVKLHSAWDTGFVRGIQANRPVAATAARLSSQFASDIRAWTAAGINLDEWARDTHRIAEDVSYGKLPTRIPVETPANPPIDNCPTLAKAAIALNAAYRDAATSAIEKQITIAGARLALMLNDVWP